MQTTSPQTPDSRFLCLWNSSRHALFTCIALLALLAYAPQDAQAATYNVPAGGNLQAYIDAAQYGDVLFLPAGATYVGPITLRYKPNSQPFRESYITIMSAAYQSLPPRGTRVTPAHAGAMPKIVSPGFGAPAVKTEPGAHHYRLVGIEITFQTANACGVSAEDLGSYPCVLNLVDLGSYYSNQDTMSEVPHHFEIDRCYIHGLPGVYLKRGIELNSAFTDIVNSYISEVHAQGQETQAILGWNGPGPFTIVNNYLEASGINLMFGGATPSIPNLVPSDIQIRNNHFHKPPSWREGDPNFTPLPHPPGVVNHWSVKNLFELKNARRVMVEGNILENSWVDAQVGYAVLFTVRGEGGAAPWATVEDVQFTNNIVRHAAAGMQILGRDCANNVCSTTKRITVRNNLFDDINSTRWNGGYGALLVITEGADRVTFDHNTVFQNGNVLVADGAANTNFVFTNNIALHNDYGIHGSGTSPGNNAIATYFPGGDFRRNIITGANPAVYPPDNYYPPTLNNVGFVNHTSGDYHGYQLASGSPYKNGGTDGTDPGFDVNALDKELNSNPIDNTRFFVYRHYIDVLRRAPDQGGWDAWVNVINGCPSGNTQCVTERRVQTARDFFFSPESMNNNPGLTNMGAFGTPERHSFNEELVEQLYIVYLGRLSEPSGKTAWVNYADSSGDYYWLVHGFVYSSEYRSKYGQP